MPEIPPNALFSTFAFIGFFLAGFSIPKHMQSWNTGVCMYMLWTSLGCLILFINSIVWNDNVTNWAPVWCDISSRYIIGGSVGIPASSLCIIRRLYYITRLQTVSVGKKERRREIAVDVSIGIGFPSIIMALQYIVQADRFDIVEQIGCYPNTVNTLAAYFLVFLWPVVIGLISFVYAVLTFRRAFLQKEQLKILFDTSFPISAGHYWRLMALCSSEIVFTIPLGLFSITNNIINGPVVPYVSWAWTHSDFSHIGQYPVIVWRSSLWMAVGLESTRWSIILCAFVIFTFFGWHQEARDFYVQIFWSIFRRLGYSSSSSRSSVTTGSGGDQYTGSRHLSRLFEIRFMNDTSQITLPKFEARPPSEPSSSSSQHSGDEMSDPLNFC